MFMKMPDARFARHFDNKIELSGVDFFKIKRIPSVFPSFESQN